MRSDFYIMNFRGGVAKEMPVSYRKVSWQKGKKWRVDLRVNIPPLGGSVLLHRVAGCFTLEYKGQTLSWEKFVSHTPALEVDHGPSTASKRAWEHLKRNQLRIVTRKEHVKLRG